jgi:HEAT repeat protein
MFENMKIDQLSKQLYHDRADKRVSAVQSLWKINTPPAIEVLKVSLRNPNKDVRLAAAECLGYERAVKTLQHGNASLNAAIVMRSPRVTIWLKRWIFMILL